MENSIVEISAVVIGLRTSLFAIEKFCGFIVDKVENKKSDEVFGKIAKYASYIGRFLEIGAGVLNTRFGSINKVKK